MPQTKKPKSQTRSSQQSKASTRVTTATGNVTNASSAIVAVREDPVDARHAFALLVKQHMWDRERESKGYTAKHLAQTMHFVDHHEDVGRPISDLIYSGSSKQYAELKRSFKKYILTDEYIASPLATHTRALIAASYPETVQLGFNLDPESKSAFKAGPVAILPLATEYADTGVSHIVSRYVGVWHVIRYSHNGHSVVRAVLEIMPPDRSITGHKFPRFKIKYRTSRQIEQFRMEEEQPCYVTEGCILPMKNGKYMLFAGLENTSYPLFILARVADAHGMSYANGEAKARVPLSSFSGMVVRHHNDESVFFSTPCSFIRTKYATANDYPIELIRSVPETEALTGRHGDVEKIAEILEALRGRWPTDRKSALQV
jgi:hypothetical protein